MFAVEERESITDLYPENCNCCGTPLSGEDPNPYRHQTVEIPPVSPLVYDVNNLRQQASEAVAEPVEIAKRYVQQQPVVGSDETSFPQGNVDSKNPETVKVGCGLSSPL